MFLQSILHSPHALLSRYSKWLNKVSNLKIHRWFCSHCLVTWLLRLRYITGHGPENNLWFSINRPGRAVSCYLRVGQAAKVLAHAISTMDFVSDCNIKFSIKLNSFLRCFRDLIRVPRIENRVPRIRENYHQVPRIRENRVPRIREIGSLQIHTGYLTFSLKKLN